MAGLDQLVTIADVDAALKGGVAEEDRQWVVGQIGRATRLLRSRLRTIDARLLSGDLDPDLVRDVVVEAVLRVVRNPDGVYREQAGDYGYSKSVDVASGRLEFSPDDLSLLLPARPPVTASIPLVVPSSARRGWWA